MCDVVGVYVVSDVYVDYEKNVVWVCVFWCCDDVDVVCVCGDVSDDLDVFEEMFEGFKCVVFVEVFYMFGNYELWLGEVDETRGMKDFKVKIEEVFVMCVRIGVWMLLMKVCDGFWIVLVYLYYYKVFDIEFEVVEAVSSVERVMNDFWFSKWFDGMDDCDFDDVVWYCDLLNDGVVWEMFLWLIEWGDRVVSFFYFFFRFELLSEKRMFFYLKFV